MAASPRQTVTVSAPARAFATRWVSPVGGLVAVLGVAGVVLALPSAALEDWVWRSGLPSLVGAAEPPLGTTARAMLALVGGALAGAIAWSALFLLFGPGGLLAPRATSSDGVPVLRRADAHPDAPARRPLSAADLDDEDGAAVLTRTAPPPPVEQPIPADLDQPLARFHPGALPDVPREPVRPVAPLRAAPAPAPAPKPMPAPTAPPAPAVAPSIDSLLARLERGMRRRN